MVFQVTSNQTVSFTPRTPAFLAGFASDWVLGLNATITLPGLYLSLRLCSRIGNSQPIGDIGAIFRWIVRGIGRNGPKAVGTPQFRHGCTETGDCVPESVNESTNGNRKQQTPSRAAAPRNSAEMQTALVQKLNRIDAVKSLADFKVQKT